MKQQGTVVDEFKVKDKKGRERNVVFRYPVEGDDSEALAYINAARDESEFLAMYGHETPVSEKKFMHEQMENIRQGKGIFLFVLVDGRIMGSANIRPATRNTSAHIGEFGIALREEMTEIGIGSRLLEKVLEITKENLRFQIIESSFVSANVRSRKLHEKFGFREYGRLPKGCVLKDKRVFDRVLVYKQIREM